MLKKMSLLIIVGMFVFWSSCGQVSETANGYRTTIGEGADQVTVVVVKGTPYEMGQAYGQLLKGEIKECLSFFLKAARKGLPERFSYANLDAAWNSLSPFIDARFKEELQGLADGSGIDIQKLPRVHMIPVLGDYACSGVAAWGEATANDHLYHIRNLDFFKGGRLQNHPVLAIYLPRKGTPHAVPTFAGYIGAHTGMNANGVVLGEKGESPESDYPFDLNGVHFSILFRTLLYDAGTLDEALDTITSTTLIKRYYLYISDGKKETQGAAKIRVTSPDSVKLTIWKDNDPTDDVAPNVLKNVIYYTMNNDVAFTFLRENYGALDAEKMIELSRAVADDGGNLMNVVYDPTTLELWVAFAEKDEDASQREYVHLALKDYLRK